MKRYVLTGAPGAGKTAVLRQLELDGFSVVEEAATDIIALWQANGIAEPWTWPQFIDTIVRLQQIRHHRGCSFNDSVQFHDRSVVCTAALADYLEVRRPQSLVKELERITTENVFERSALFMENLGFITTSEARRITYDEAMRFEDIHRRVYRDFGFKIIEIKPGSVADRVREIKQALSLHI